MKIDLFAAQKRLMTPGPVPIPDYVKQAFAYTTLHHRTKEFSTILLRALANLKKVFQTEQPCFALPCTGTGAMEAAIVNLLNPGDEVLVVVAGKFGERWGKLAKAFGLKPDVFAVEWGRDLDLAAIKKTLAGKRYRALLVQACETSTGALLPVRELGELLYNTDTLLIVDGITALAAYDIPMDDWHIDVLIGGSQKGFMLLTGMAFVAFSAKAWAAHQQAQLTRYYWDLAGELKANKDGKTRYSTPVQFIVGLDLVLQEILKQGLPDFLAATDQRAQLFRENVHLPLFPATPSPSLSCLQVPSGVNAKDIRNRLAVEDNITIVCGQDQMADKLLRIGHMGAMTDEDLLVTAAAINRCLETI